MDFKKKASSMADSKERVQEKLMAVYKFDMEKIANDMQSVENYSDLADLYEKSATIIRDLEKELKALEDGRE